eukprot:14700050-Heterocapsa_arctica.AAC.1
MSNTVRVYSLASNSDAHCESRARRLTQQLPAIPTRLLRKPRCCHTAAMPRGPPPVMIIITIRIITITISNIFILVRAS